MFSINFNITKLFNLIKRIISAGFNKKEKNYTNQNEIIKEYIPQDEIKNLIQEDLPFIKAESNMVNNKTKFNLPSLELLKTPAKNERSKSDKGDDIDPKFLEKILLDFG